MNRRPKVGDSASLWNFTLSPGWTREECEILRQAIMKFGFGSWSKIIDCGCLPGKTRAQLNLQSQRMIGQQSLGEFMGIRLDPAVIFNENSQKTEVTRKNGAIINTGNNPTKEERQMRIEENRKKYELTAEASDKIELIDKRNTKEAKKERLRIMKEKLAYLERVLKQREEAREKGLINEEKEEQKEEVEKKKKRKTK
eukprot:TRINITY_DN2439_c0_g1_i1.p1 TRINITY_DN2439_c0_g1~~TRINITY_DN2439_c0_g1_i1.p1  ORF type:complete len:198 (-),score=66.33 TRINITY_DN2439_c0_g1_i1:76-669(-)